MAMISWSHIISELSGAQNSDFPQQKSALNRYCSKGEFVHHISGKSTDQEGMAQEGMSTLRCFSLVGELRIMPKMGVLLNPSLWSNETFLII